MHMPHQAPPADDLHHRIRHAVQQQWQAAGLPGAPAIDAQALQLGGDGNGYPSSFAVDVAAGASVAAATLAAAQLGSLRSGSALASASVQVPHALAETTGYFTLDGVQPDLWSPISGLYPCGAAVGQPGWVRIHANFDHHRDGVLQLLGLSPGGLTQKQAVAHALKAWNAIDFEAKAAERGLVVAAARTPDEWVAHPQSAAVAAQPLVQITPLDAEQPAPPRAWPALQKEKESENAAPLSNIRVLDLTRILSGPVAARTLAAHGAEVLMVNGPGLPNIGAIADLSRGKRSALLDLKSAAGKAQFASLLGGAHVLLQGYHPGSLDALGFGPQQAAQWRPGIVYASLSAYGRSGPWADRRGFDSLVQTASGINWAEGQAFEGIAGSSGLRALPMQILDYAAGFWLAFGIQAALYRQATQGGSWHVQVSLARTAQWLHELGQRPVLPQQAGGAAEGGVASRAAPYLETLASGFGTLVAVRPSGVLGGAAAPWLHPSMPPGSAAPQWL